MPSSSPRGTTGHAVVLEDLSDTWSHDLVAYESEIGRFACTSVRRTERRPVRSVVEVESTFGALALVGTLGPRRPRTPSGGTGRPRLARATNGRSSCASRARWRTRP